LMGRLKEVPAEQKREFGRLSNEFRKEWETLQGELKARFGAAASS